MSPENVVGPMGNVQGLPGVGGGAAPRTTQGRSLAGEGAGVLNHFLILKIDNLSKISYSVKENCKHE